MLKPTRVPSVYGVIEYLMGMARTVEWRKSVPESTDTSNLPGRVSFAAAVEGGSFLSHQHLGGCTALTPPVGIPLPGD